MSSLMQPLKNVSEDMRSGTGAVSYLAPTKRVASMLHVAAQNKDRKPWSLKMLLSH